MKLLALSTAEQGCSLALTDGPSLICEDYWNIRETHSRRLVSMIENALENRAGMALEDVDGFLAARGPGSFTGVRIGISVIQGLALAMGKPAVGISSLDGIAYRFTAVSMPVLAMMDAKRNEVYWALYRFDRGILAEKSPEAAGSPEKAVEAAGKQPVLFAGSGARAFQALIAKSADHPIFADGLADFVSAAALVRSFYAHGRPLSDPALRPTPRYLRASDAEKSMAVSASGILT